MSNSKKLVVVGSGLFVLTTWMVADAVLRGVSGGWAPLEWALVMGLPVCSLLLVWVGWIERRSAKLEKRLAELNLEPCVICADPARLGSFTCGHAACERQVRDEFRKTYDREAQRSHLERCFTRNVIR